MFTCEYPLLASWVEKGVASPKKPMYPIMCGMGFEFRRLGLLHFLLSAQKQKEPFIFATKAMVATHSFRVGSIRFWESTFSILTSWSAHKVGPTRYSAAWTVFEFDSMSIPFLATLIQQRCLSHIVKNCLSICQN